MHTRSRPIRIAAAGTALLLSVALVSGCGSKHKDSGSTTGTAKGGVNPPEPTVSAPGDIDATTTTTAMPVPKGGPREIAHFPVPDGVKLKAPAPAQHSWQFDLQPVDVDKVLAFYRKALADEGYTVKNDVNVKIGIEKVHYNIQFSGKADGYIVADKSEKDVFVVVNQLPS